MLRQILILFTTFSLLTFALQSCSGSKEIDLTEDIFKDGKKPSGQTDDERLSNLFIDGVKARTLGDTEKAMSLFGQCLKIDQENAAVHYELARLNFELSRLTDAREYARLATKFDPENKFYASLYADILTYLTQFEEAAEVYKNLTKSDPDDVENFLQWAYLLENSGKTSESIDVLNIVEDRFGPDESIIKEKQRMYMKLGKVEDAAEEVKKLLEISGNDPYYYGLLAQLYEASNQLDKAEEIYNQLLQQDDGHPEVMLQIADFHRKKGNTKLYFEKLSEAFSNHEIEIDRKIILVLPYVDSMGTEFDNKERVLELNRIIVETHSEDPKSYALYGDFLYFDDKKEEAKKTYLQSLELNPSIFEVWRKLFFIDADLRNFESLSEQTSKAIELFPNQPLSYFFRGFSLNQLQQYSEAVKVLKRALPMTIGNEDLKADIYSNLGDAYHELKEFKKSDEAYENSLLYDPNNVFVLNNFAYYLSLRNENLEKALEMSGKTNELVPDNSSFEDTYAWILFKLERFEDAKTWLEKAMANGGMESGVILEHYGDVLYKLGKIDQAVEYWEKAKSKNVESDIIDKKISDRKLYE